MSRLYIRLTRAKFCCFRLFSPCFIIRVQYYLCDVTSKKNRYSLITLFKKNIIKSNFGCYNSIKQLLLFKSIISFTRVIILLWFEYCKEVSVYATTILYNSFWIYFYSISLITVTYHKLLMPSYFDHRDNVVRIRSIFLTYDIFPFYFSKCIFS